MAKNIIIVIMAVVILVLTWLLFQKDSGRYCKPAGFRKEMMPPQADTLKKDTVSR